MSHTIVETTTTTAAVEAAQDASEKKRKAPAVVKRPISRRMHSVPDYKYEKIWSHGKQTGKRIHYKAGTLRKRQHHFYSESKKGQYGLVVSRSRTGSKLHKHLKKTAATMNALVNVCSNGKRNEAKQFQLSQSYIFTNALYLNQLYEDIYSMLERRATQANGHVNKVTEYHVNDVLQMRKLF